MRAFVGWILVLVLLPVPTSAELPPLSLSTLATGIGVPVAATHAGDERLFLTLQDGRVVVWDGDEVLAQPFLDIRHLVSFGGERGLFSVAFHPDYPRNGLFFVNYTDNAGDTVVARYRVSDSDSNRAEEGSAVVLLQVDQPFSNHNGGQLQFGPDGFLYIGMGDGGSAFDPQCNAQRPGTLLGKLLRIDVDASSPELAYGIPQDNPFLGRAFRDEVWAIGLRNPWRFSFDRERDDLFIADVGQSSREEIDFQPASSSGGENYGWKRMEGSLCLGSVSGCPQPVPPCDDPTLVDPILEYANGGGNCAVVGGYVYRGAAISGLQGVYLFGDFCSGVLWGATRNGDAWTREELGLVLPGLTSFGEGVDGEIYLTSEAGTLARLDGPPAEPGRLRFARSSSSVPESAGAATLQVRRVGGSDGTVSVRYATAEGTAGAGIDYTPAEGTLSWADGDSSPKSFDVAVLDDTLVEDDETILLSLSDPAGAELVSPSQAVLEIVDDDVLPEECVAGPTTLCLQDRRFRVETQWEDFSDDRGFGQAVALSGDAGYFWFFAEENVELVVKVVDGCETPFDAFWVFAAGLTNVEVTLRLVDTATGARKTYANPKGEPFAPVQDTAAFATCP